MTRTGLATQVAQRLSSFRDPNGAVVEVGGRIFRLVRGPAVDATRKFLESRLCRTLVEERLLVATWEAQDAGTLGLELGIGQEALEQGNAGLLLEHEAIWFPSYPHEWPAEMLWEAGRLTLELCDRSLEHGFGLKDATPYNVLFCGPRPVFVDVLSFEPRDPTDFVWRAYGQFVRTFLLPLALWRFSGVTPGVVFLSSREGLTPEQAARWLGPVVRLRRPVLTLATVPSWLSRWADRMGEGLHRHRPADPEVAQHALRALFRGLRGQLERLRPRVTTGSGWSRYEEEAQRFAPEARRAKHEWVVTTLRRLEPETVLDLGCNTGTFALAAAELGARVVAVDRDPVVVGRAWREAARGGRDVLSLVVDVTRPTPALGWRNLECRSFLDRARDRFDGVLMLALVHHLVVSERVPVEEVAVLARELSRRFALVEFVPREDPMFRRLLRGRHALFESWTQERFEAAFRRWFEVADVMDLPCSGRRLYCLLRRE